MRMDSSVTNEALAPARVHYTIGSVTSKDGTRVGYRQYGHGPGVVLVQKRCCRTPGGLSFPDSIMDQPGITTNRGTRTGSRKQ